MVQLFWKYLTAKYPPSGIRQLSGRNKTLISLLKKTSKLVSMTASGKSAVVLWGKVLWMILYAFRGYFSRFFLAISKCYLVFWFAVRVFWNCFRSRYEGHVQVNHFPLKAFLWTIFLSSHFLNFQVDQHAVLFLWQSVTGHCFACFFNVK